MALNFNAFNGRYWFGGEHPDTAQERRPGIVCADAALAGRQLWLRDRQPADAGGRHGGRHDLSLDAADAGRRPGEHLSGVSAWRSAAQILPDNRNWTNHPQSPARGMEKLHDVDRENARGRTVSRTLFIGRLRQGLKGLSPAEIDEIVMDYEAHFSDAMAAGRSEVDVAASLGDGLQLGNELRAETKLRRWETRRSPRNFVQASLG